MRLTRAGEYAVRCTVYLSILGQGVVAKRKDVARSMQIPDQFLTKIAQQLARAGVIDIIQGPQGGYRLNRPPQQISLLEVVEAVIGEIFINDCLSNPGLCRRSPSCAVHQVWDGVRRQLRASLQQVSMADLTTGESCIDELLK